MNAPTGGAFAGTNSTICDIPDSGQDCRVGNTQHIYVVVSVYCVGALVVTAKLRKTAAA